MSNAEVDLSTQLHKVLTHGSSMIDGYWNDSPPHFYAKFWKLIDKPRLVIHNRFSSKFLRLLFIGVLILYAVSLVDILLYIKQVEIAVDVIGTIVGCVIIRLLIIYFFVWHCQTHLQLLSSAPIMCIGIIYIIISAVCPFLMLYANFKLIQIHYEYISTRGKIIIPFVLPRLGHCEKYIDWFLNDSYYGSRNHHTSINTRYINSIKYYKDLNNENRFTYSKLLRCILNTKLVLFYNVYPYFARRRLSNVINHYINVDNEFQIEKLKHKETIFRYWKIFYWIDFGFMTFLFLSHFVIIYNFLYFCFDSNNNNSNTNDNYNNSNAERLIFGWIAVLIFIGLVISAIFLSIYVYRDLYAARILYTNIDPILIEDELQHMRKHHAAGSVNLNSMLYYETGAQWIKDVFYGKDNCNCAKIQKFIETQILFSNYQNLKIVIASIDSLDSISTQIPDIIVKLILGFTHTKRTSMKTMLDFVLNDL